MSAVLKHRCLPPPLPPRTRTVLGLASRMTCTDRCWPWTQARRYERIVDGSFMGFWLEASELEGLGRMIVLFDEFPVIHVCWVFLDTRKHSMLAIAAIRLHILPHVLYF